MLKLPENKTGIIETPMQVATALLLGVVLGLAAWAFPNKIMIGLGGIIIMLIALKRPEFAVLGVIILLATIVPENRIPIVNVGPGRLYITEPLIILLIVVIFLRWLSNPAVKLKNTPVDVPLIVFYLWALISTLLAVAQSSVEISDAIPEIRNLSYYLIFFVITNLVIKEKNIKSLINVFFWLATITAAAMIIQYYLGYSLPFLEGRVEELDPISGVTRITDTPGEATITIAFILKSVFLLTNKLQKRTFVDFLQWILVGAAVLMTYNRTHWIMVAFAILATFYLVRSQKREKFIYWMIILFFIVLAVISFSSVFPQYEFSQFINSSISRFASLRSMESYSSNSSTLSWRSFEYRYGFPQILAHPVFGLGLGAAYRPTLQNIDYAGFYGEKYTHNGLLWIAMKTGVIGFVLIMLVFIIPIVQGLKNWRKINDPLLQSVFLGTTLLLIGLMIGTNIHPLIITTFWTPLLGIFMGLNQSILNIVKET